MIYAPSSSLSGWKKEGIGANTPALMVRERVGAVPLECPLRAILISNVE